jgi:hypothetical protein
MTDTSANDDLDLRGAQTLLVLAANALERRKSVRFKPDERDSDTLDRALINLGKRTQP